MRLNLNFKKTTRPALWLLVLTASLPARLFAADTAAKSVPATPDWAEQAELGRRIIHLLDYIARDYGGAVQDHQVLNPTEYSEQVEFVKELTRLTGRQGELQSDPKIAAGLDILSRAVGEKAEPDQVGYFCRDLRKLVIEKLALITFPTRRPDLAQGALYYSKNCSSCHGIKGRGDGFAAPNLKPRPADLTSERMAGISPYQITNTVRYGVKGTGMAAHPEVDDQTLWNIAFFASSLRHQAAGITPVKGPKDSPVSGPLSAPKVAPEITLSLTEMASLSDRQLLEKYGPVTGLSAGDLGRLRLAPPAPEEAHPDFSFARARLAEALEAYRNRDLETARRLSLDAYLEGVEPFETTLKPNHGPYVSELENGMARVRDGIGRNLPENELAGLVNRTDQLLLRGDSLLENHALSPAVAFTTAVAILLREGLEALLIVVLLLGIAGNTGMHGARAAAHFGWICALGAGVLTWMASLWLMRFSGAGRETLEGVTALVAVAVLVYVGFWLHSKTEISRWHAFLQAKSQIGGTRAGWWGIFFASFIAVYREVFETVLFYQTLWLRAGVETKRALFAGIAGGFLLVIVLGWLLLVAGRKLPLRKLFQFSAVIMLLLAIILTGKGFHAFQESGLLPITFINGLEKLKISDNIELFGIYSTLETLIPQLIVGVVILLLWGLGQRLMRDAATVKKAAQPANGHPASTEILS
jgi:high-affinity iron transporter